VTVLRGPSIAELILSPEKIDYTAITHPSVILVLAEEGVTRRRDLFGQVDERTLVIQAAGVAIPETLATVKVVDFTSLGLKAQDWAVGALAVMAEMRRVIDGAMLNAALEHRFEGKLRETERALVAHVTSMIGEQG
jgi:2-oxoglutarate/2-oxoacid ferredoxin oxidoreductase subunit beta